MTRYGWWMTGVLAIALVAGCGGQRLLAGGERATGPADARGFTPRQAEVAIGIRLFFDPRLSRTNRVSCGTCHQPKRGFTDGLPVGRGVEGRTGRRNTPTVLTAKHSPMQFWDGRAATLEEQALGPIVNPVEMDQDLDELVVELNAIPMYQRLFGQAYGTGVTTRGIARSLAAFERALEVKDSPYDRWLAGDDDALSPAAKRGQELFAVRAHCGECHKGPDLTDHAVHNLGWGLMQPQPDLGRFEVTNDPSDWAAFKTPTLRNIAQTAPYFHDGRAETLEAVIDHYNTGGSPNPNLDPKIVPIGLSEEEKQDLVAFMQALTSETNLKEIAREAVEKREIPAGAL